LDKAIIGAVKSELSLGGQRLLEKQMDSINLVQRQMNREVNLYNMKGRESVRPSDLQFPNRTKETRLATVSFEAIGHDGTYAATLYLVKGFLFSIVYNSDVTKLQTEGQSVKILSVKLFQDPMKEIPEEPKRVDLPTNFSGFLHELNESFTIRVRNLPLNPDDRLRFYQNIPAGLPIGYIQLIEQVDGIDVESCSIFGLSEVHEISFPDAIYVLLAEYQGMGALAVRADSSDQILYFLEFNSDQPLRVNLYTAS
jgi:hypothetical protein